MNKQDITQMFIEAKELVSGIEEQYRGLALKVVFRWLLDQSLGPVQPASSPAAAAVPPSMALNEFLASTKPKPHKDLVLRIAQYYLKFKKEPVTRAEFKEAYSLARRSPPQNRSDIIAKCARKGYLMVYPSRKEGKEAWQITQTGEKYLEEHVAKA